MYSRIASNDLKPLSWLEELLSLLVGAHIPERRQEHALVQTELRRRVAQSLSMRLHLGRPAMLDCELGKPLLLLESEAEFLGAAEVVDGRLVECGIRGEYIDEVGLLVCRKETMYDQLQLQPLEDCERHNSPRCCLP